jgi:hypothetical protein
MVQMNDNIVGLDFNIDASYHGKHLDVLWPLIDNKDSKEDIEPMLKSLLLKQSKKSKSKNSFDAFNEQEFVTWAMV